MSTSTSVKARASWAELGLFALVLGLFFVSGACGLVYQVVWTRKLVLLFGTTSYAVSAVLSVFFLGLGAGSLWGGRLADRSAYPLALYGVMEVAIGLWAALFLLALGWGEGVVAGILQAVSASRATGIGLRVALAFALLLLPTFLMGATLPLLARYSTARVQVSGRRTGLLYALNTFGAVIGCALAGFVLIPRFGYNASTLLAAAANLLVGAAALAVGVRASRTTGPGASETPPPPTPATPGDGERAPANAAALTAAFALSGFCMLALEVIWTRLLTIVYLGTTYAFTTMLATLLCGIATGGLAGGLMGGRVRRPGLWFGVAQGLCGAACVAVLAQFAALPEMLIEYRQSTGFRWEEGVRYRFWLTFLVLFPPTFLSGLSFPLAVRGAVAALPRLGRDVGRLYSANTLGGVLGALAGGYALLPWLGTHTGALVLGALLAVSGVAVTLLHARSGRVLAWAGAGVTATAFLAAWAAAPADVARAVNRWYIPEDHHPIHFDESVEATVLVAEEDAAEEGSDRVLYINAVQATASIEKGVRMNRLQGALPLLFETDPKDVLFMCFGSGITAGTLAQYDFDRIDAVEIAPAVLEAAPLFRADNLGVAESERVNFIVDDGRNYLLTTPRRYDVITFEPMPLALAGVSTFYTEEYYRLCLDRLRPGGLVSQWAPLHSLNPDIVKALVRTFTAVFPHYCAFYINADLFLMGSDEPLVVDFAAAERRLNQPAIRSALEGVDLWGVPEVLGAYLLDAEGMRAFAGGGPVMTDDRPWAEFEAPKLIYERKVAEGLRQLLPHRAQLLPPRITYRGLTQAEEREAMADLDRRFRSRGVTLEGVAEYYGSGVLARPEAYFKEALRIDPGDKMARYYVKQLADARVELFLRWGDYGEARSYLTELLALMPLDETLAGLLADVEEAAERGARAVEASKEALPGADI